MTDADIRTAVARGQGRAILFLRSAPDQAYFDLVLDLCKRDQAFDRLFENRIDYMWRLANTLPVPADLVKPLGDRLLQAKDRRDRMQVRWVLGRFREAGSEEARQILLRDFKRFRLTERPYTDAVELLGFEGLELLIGQADRLEDRELQRTYEEAVEQFGKRRSDRAFRKLARTDIRAARLLSGTQAERPRKPRKPMKTAAECIQQLRDGGGWSGEFERVANESDWIEVAQIATATTDDAVLRGAGRIFARHPWPLDVETTLRHALAEPDELIRHKRLHMLQATKSELIREWALAQLSNQRLARENSVAFDLLELNAWPEDRELIASGLRHLIRDKDTFHRAGLAVLNLTVRPTAELCQLIYEYGYCDECRNYVIRELVKRRAITIELLRECVEDSCEDTQKWARDTLRRRGRSPLSSPTFSTS